MVKIQPWMLWLGLGVAVYVATRGIKDTTAGVVSGALEVPAGVVLGVGDSIGIPRTDINKCQLAKQNNNHWDASLYCTAGDFLQWELSSKYF